jgi:hypothetical protein
MPRLRTLVAALLVQALVAGTCAATEYVLSTGVALPEGRAARSISLVGMRHVLPGGVFGEVAVARLSSLSGGALSTMAYAKPWRHVRAGAGVLALRLPDQTEPGRPAVATTAGFQFGCGLQVPVAAGVGVDLDARYVFMERPSGQAAPDPFASRYWSITLGLAILGEK